MTEATPGEIHLAWVPERADYRDALVARNRSRRMYWRFAAGVGAAALAVAVGVASNSATLVGVGIGVGVCLLTILALQPLAVRRFWSGTPHLQEPSSAVLSPRGGPDHRTQRSSGHFDWAMFDSCLETGRSFIVQLRGRRKPFVVLPKRAFRDTADIDRARAVFGELERGVHTI